MKKIFAFVGTVILMIFMISCGNDEIPTSSNTTVPDTSTTVDKVISHIEIEGVTTTIMQNEVYNHSGVKVYARFEDNSREDVTSLATFSSINTQNVGTKTVTVTYKTFTKSYEITVVAVTVERIECGTSNMTLNYEVGSVIDFSALKVTAVYSNNTKADITNYSIAVKNSSGNVINYSSPLTEVGTYLVTISYENKSNDFNVYAYTTTSTYNEVLNINSLVNEYTLINGRYTFNTNEIILDEEYAKLEINGEGSVLETVDENSESISQHYGENTFTSRIKITEGASEFKLTLEEAADVIMYVGGKSGRSLNISSGNTQILPLGNISQSVSVLTVSLPEGEYLINSTYEDLYLYMMQFNYDTEEPTPAPDENTITVTFGYSGTTYQEWTRTITLGDAINPADYIQTPDGYVFLGFSPVDWHNLRDGDFIKLYVEREKLNQYTVAYLTENYERFEVTYVTMHQNATPISTYPEVEGKVFIGWDDTNLNPVTSNIFVLPKYAVDGGDVEITTSDVSSTSATITLPGDNTNTYTFNVNVEANGFSQTIDNLEITLTGLAPNTTYTVSGTYVATPNTRAITEPTVYTVNSTFTTEAESAPETVTVTFGYSGAGTGSIPTWTEDITLDGNVNPADYIQVPTGYAFIGFSWADWNNMPDGEFIKIYVEREKTNQYTVTYLNLDFERFETVYVNKNTNATPITTYPEVAGKVFIGWDDTNLYPVTSNIYVLPKYAVDGGDVEITTSDVSSTSATITLPGDNTNTYTFNVNVEANGFSQTINNLETTLTGLAPNTTYTVSGTYIATPNTRAISEPTVYTVNSTFTTEADENTITVTFGYSGEGTGSIPTWTEGITLDGNVNPADYIQVPAGYAFIGFSWADWNNMPDGEFIKIYVEREKTNQYTVTYLNLDFERFETVYVNKNTNATPITTYPEVAGKVFIGWDDTNLNPVTSNIYVLPQYGVDGGDVEITTSDVSSTSATITLPGDNTNTYTFNVNVEANGFSQTINNLETTLTGLAPNTTYTVSGTYIATPNTRAITEPTVYTVNSTFTTEAELAPVTVTVQFGYSGPGVGSIPFWTEDITLDGHVNPADYIQTPDGYVFTGFGWADWNNLRDGDFIKIYVEKEQLRQYTVAYLTENYETYEVTYVTMHQNATPISTHPEVAGKVFIGWDTTNITPVMTDTYVLPKYATNAGDLNTSIVFNSASSVTIDLNLESNITYNYHISVTGSGYERNITQSTTTLSDLASNTTYTLSGYVTYTQNNTDYIAYLEESNFTTSVYQELESFTEELCAIEEYSNGITVETGAFVTNAPTGYVLDSLAIFHNGSLVEEVMYDSQETISFFDLEADQEYRVDAFYRLADVETLSLQHYAKLPVTPGYRIHFVGFFVVCSAENNQLCSLKMTYDTETLYTFYYAQGSNVYTNVFSFMLPIKYEDLTIAGSLDYEYTINSNSSWELILLDLSAPVQDKYTVIFYERTTKGKIASFQEVNRGDAATAPTIPTYYSEDQKYRYDFKDFNRAYDNILNNTLITPNFTSTMIVQVNVEYEVGVYAASTHISPFYNTVVEENGYGRSFVYSIEGGAYTTKTKMTGSYFTVTPNTSYTITMEYTYKDQNKNDITKSSTIQVTTPQSDQTNTGDIAEVIATDAQHMTFKCTNNVQYVEFLGGSSTVVEHYNSYKNTSTHPLFSTTLGEFVRNATYDVYYYLRDTNNTKIYYSYYYGTATTPDAARPDIYKILVSTTSNDIYLFGSVDSNLSIYIEIGHYFPENPGMSMPPYTVLVDSSMFSGGVAIIQDIGYSAVNPDTGVTEEYEIEVGQMNFQYKYDNKFVNCYYDFGSGTETYKGKVCNIYLPFIM